MCHTKECGFLRLNGCVIDPEAPRNDAERNAVAEYYRMTQELENLVYQQKELDLNERGKRFPKSSEPEMDFDR